MSWGKVDVVSGLIPIVSGVVSVIESGFDDIGEVGSFEDFQSFFAGRFFFGQLSTQFGIIDFGLFVWFVFHIEFFFEFGLIGFSSSDEFLSSDDFFGDDL